MIPLSILPAKKQTIAYRVHKMAGYWQIVNKSSRKSYDVRRKYFNQKGFFKLNTLSF